MRDVQTHLEAIYQIDNHGRDSQRERARAVEALTRKVVNSIIAGHTAPVSAQLLTSTEGFVEAFAAELVKRHGEAMYDRASLAIAVEQSGCQDGAAAARILRAMNTETNFKDIAARHGLPTADQARAELARLRADLARLQLDEFDADSWAGNQARLADSKAALLRARGETFAGVDVQASETWTVRDTTGDEAEPTQPIDDLVRGAIAELGSNPDTDAITHTLPVDGCWVEVKIEPIEDEDTGPEYDTVSQNDIRVGDIAEYHWDGKVRRWEVLDVREHLIPGIGPERACLKLIGEHNSSEITVGFPLLEDPFILRPRS